MIHQLNREHALALAAGNAACGKKRQKATKQHKRRWPEFHVRYSREMLWGRTETEYAAGGKSKGGRGFAEETG
ncbi:MAG: hypothetical protein ACKV2V_18750, partial [Blastocatellia bacterium]